MDSGNGPIPPPRTDGTSKGYRVDGSKTTHSIWIEYDTSPLVAGMNRTEDISKGHYYVLDFMSINPEGYVIGDPNPKGPIEDTDVIKGWICRWVT